MPRRETRRPRRETRRPRKGTRRIDVLGCLPLLALLAACGPEHISPYEPRVREYSYPVALEAGDAASTPGSLWREDRPSKDLFRDQRALRKGDLVVVRVEERADARRGASTDLSRDGSMQAKVDEFLSMVSGKEIKAGMGTSFSGSGQTSRTERLEATVPAIVIDVLPNGNLFVEGRRVVLVNMEEHHFYISGVVRPFDVGPDNSIPSSLIADAEIEFSGRGVVSDKQRPGWLHRGMDYVSPF